MPTDPKSSRRKQRRQSEHSSKRLSPVLPGREGDVASELENFTFDVSARSSSLGGGRRLDFLSPPLSRPIRSASSRRIEAPAAPLLPDLQQHSTAPLQLEPDPSGAPSKLKTSRSWEFSLAAHAVLLVVLGFSSLANLQEQPDFFLVVSPESYEPIDELEALELEPLEVPEPEIQPLASTMAEASLASLSIDEAIGELVGEAFDETSFAGEFSNLLAAEGGRGSAPFDEAEEHLAATFFGSRIEGKRIVFVVDNSGGMRGGELEALIMELQRSVDSLVPEQRFYVIFYSDMLYPLYYPTPAQQFVPANERHQNRLRQWLATVEFSMGNEVDQALAAAGAIHPDVVYLLTDGDLDQTRDQRRLAFLLDARQRNFAVHTIGLGTGENSKAAQKLKQVAEANRGTFRAVEVSEAAKKLAEKNARPYHKKEPGAVWGRQAGANRW